MTKGYVKKDQVAVITEEFINKLIDKIGRILKDQYTLFERDSEKQESIELLLDKVGLIENNFEELSKSLAKGSYPLKLARSVRVTESLIPPKIEAVKISKSQLIATYNEIVALLSGYVIAVTLTPDSYRDLNHNRIILETTIKGNYWVVTTIEKKQHKYWLVPNSNLNFNIHKLKTIKTLFQLKGDYNSPTTEFILQEPAILSLLPNNKQWQLIQPGILFFSKNIKSVSSQSKLSKNGTDDNQSKITNQMFEFQTKIEQLNNKIKNFETQSEISQKYSQREKQSLYEQHLSIQEQNTQEIKNLKEQVAELKSRLETKNYYSDDEIKKTNNSTTPEHIQSSPPIENTPVYFVEREVNNVCYGKFEAQEGSFYNETDDREYHESIDAQVDTEPKANSTDSYQNFYRLIKNRELEVTQVVVTQETMEKMRGGTLSELRFSNASRGKYWVINWQGTYCLIPKEKIYIEQHNYGDFKRVFNCQDYQENYSEIEVIEPAIVSNCDVETWLLERKGKIKFI